MNTSVLDHDVKRYVDAVAAALADLAEATRTDILEDLAAHLSEFDLANGPLDVQLGDPAAYAQELRASAGLAAAGEVHARRWPDRVERTAGSARSAFARLRATTWWHEFAELRPELRPAWWVMRGWLALRVLHGPARLNVPLPRLAGGLNGPLGLVVRVVALGAAVLLSVRLGRAQMLGRRRVLGLALSGLAVISALAFVAQIDDPEHAVYYQTSSPYNGDYGADAAGRTVRPVMVFDEAGRLLTQRAPALVDAGGTVIAAQGQQVMVNGRFRDLMPCADDKRWALCVVPDIGGAGVTGASGAVVPSTPAAPTTVTVAPTSTVPAGPTSSAPAPTTTVVAIAPTTSVG